MTTAGGGENIAIVIAAEDRASRKIKQVGDSLRKNLGTSIRSAALSMISFTAILSGVGLSITALIGVAKKFVGDIIKTNRAAAVLGLRFRQMGFDAERASSAVSNLRDNLSRGMVQSLRELSDEALALFESFSPESIKDIEKYVKILANAWKVDQKQALKDYMELQMGNTEALRQYGLAGLPVIEVNKELDRVQQDILDNQTPLEKMWIALKTAASAAMHEMLADVNDVFGDNGIVGIIRGALNLIGAGFGKARLGDRMVEEVTKMVNAVKKFDLGAIVEWAENLAKSIIGGIGSFLTASVDKVTGFVQTLIGLALNIGSWLKEKGQAVAGWIVDGLKWLSGTDAVGKLESWLKLAIALATTIGSWLKERGEAVAGSLLDGIKGLIGKGLNVARWISEALHLPDLFQRGVDLARGLAQGLLNGSAEVSYRRPSTLPLTGLMT